MAATPVLEKTIRTFKEGLNEALEESQEYIDPQEILAFENQIASARWAFIRPFLEGVKKYVDPEKKHAFEHRLISIPVPSVEIPIEIEIYIDPKEKPAFERLVIFMLGHCVEALGKEAKAYSFGKWAKVAPKWRELHTEVEVWSRRLEFLHPPTPKELAATLKWMVEQGVEEDLDLLQEARKANPSSSEDIDHLFDIAEQRIIERINDPGYVLKTGEEAYQRNRERWDKEYNRQYIAIYRGGIVDADRDKSELFKRLIQAQKEKGRFRAYIVHVGAPVIAVRGPSRLRQGMDRSIQSEE